MANRKMIVDFRTEVLAQSSAFILPTIFVISFLMTIADFFMDDKNLLRNLDQYLYMFLSILGLLEYLIFRELRMLKFIVFVYLGGSQIYRILSQSEISTISMAWIPPSLLLISFVYSLRFAISFIILYSTVPILIFLGMSAKSLPNLFILEPYSSSKIFVSLLGALSASLCFTYVFELYRRRIQLALKKNSRSETEEKFFATLSHEINNPINIATLALNRNYQNAEDPRRDRILENLNQLAQRSKEFESYREKFRL